MKKFFFAVFFLFAVLSICIFGQSNDKSLDGIWQLTTNQDLIFVFRGDTWRILQDNEIIGNGMFRRTSQESIFCILDEKIWFELGYSLAGNTLTVNNCRQNLWMIGQWKKISSNNDLTETNPLVGTWKSISEDKIIIYQFYSDGTGIKYESDLEISSLKRNDKISYELINNTSGKISEIIGDPNFLSFDVRSDIEIKGNDLIIISRTYKRE